VIKMRSGMRAKDCKLAKMSNHLLLILRALNSTLKIECDWVVAGAIGLTAHEMHEDNE
jgi:hypothetical protein